MDLPIALPQLTGDHSKEEMAEVICKTMQEFGINPLTIGYFILDNASNNNSAVLALAQTMSFNAIHCRLCCGPYTLNLIGQMLLWARTLKPITMMQASLLMRMSTWVSGGATAL
jgi:hypothetical protein